MALENYLRPEYIIPMLESLEKETVIRELLKPLVAAGTVADGEKAYADILEREGMCSTGLEGGIAIPHAKTDQADNVGLVIGIHHFYWPEPVMRS